MFAVIMQSQYSDYYGNATVRQTAVVPMTNDPKTGMLRAPRVFTRTHATRGVSGAWKEETPMFDNSEVTLGSPRAIKLTENNRQMLEFPITPQTVMQRLLREVEEVVAPTATPASDTFSSLLEIAVATPLNLVQYTSDVQPTVQPISPTISVVHEPVVEPVVETVQPEPVSITIEAPVTMEYVPEEVVASVTHTPTESENLVQPTMSFQSTVHHDDADAVLVVPDVQPYFTRTWFGKSEADVYDYARSTQQSILLTGPAGTGKTSSARNYAAQRKLPFVVIECTQQIDQSITQGRFIPTGEGNTVKWKYSQLATAIQQPSVILLNELTRMTPKAASLFLRLLHERELAVEPLNQVIKVHPECIIIADQNTGFGYTGTSKQDLALLDRFNLKLEFKYDEEIEAQFIKSPALLAFAQGIRHSADANDEFSVPMSTRVLLNFQAQAQNLGFEFAVNSMLNNFPKTDGEREAIKMRLDADAYTIASELGVEYQDYNAN